MDLTQSIHELARRLLAKHWCMATAESCTGGGIAYALTQIPGSSDWFECGLVTYSNAAKHELLGVSLDLIAKHGAVSEAVAVAMATGVIARYPVDVSVAVTGIAGPGGGSVDKPVGTVWFAWAGREITTQTRLMHFDGDRQAVREQAIQFVILELLSLIP